MPRTYGQYCGVATALELVGERWALLIVRDLLVGPRRYTDLKQGLPKIPTNILSTRLKELQDGGVVRRVHLAHCGLVYELTESGRELEEAVLALGRWGFRAMAAPDAEDVITSDSLTTAFRTAFRPTVAASQPPAAYEVHVGSIALLLRVSPTGLRISPLRPTRLVDRHDAAPAADLVLTIGSELRALIAGELTPAEALARDVVSIQVGDPELLATFTQTFHIDPAPEPLPTFA